MARESVINLRANHDFSSKLKDAWSDFVNSFGEYRVWSALAVNDIATRYRGSLLGPLWITLTTATFVGGIGILYANIMHQNISDYLPFLSAGLVLWNAMSAMILEGCDAFVAGAGIIKQSNIPLMSFIWRVIYRNGINFLHQIVIVVITFAIFDKLISVNLLLAVCGLLLVVVNVSWIGLVAALLSTRFRDVPQVVQAVMQILFFVTPVMWTPSSVAREHFVLDYNIFYYFLDTTRSALLGGDVELSHYLILICTSAFGWMFAFIMFSLIRRKIVHFL